MKRECLVALASVACVSMACGGTTAPSASSSLLISSPSPATGSTIHVAGGGAVGTFIARGSGQLSIPITVTSGRQLAWAQLYVYLMTADDPDSYCAQNLPDAPGWGLARGQTESVTITGFQVFRLPCDVIAQVHTPTGPVFTTPIGTPLDERNVRREFDNVLTAAKLPGMRIHDLRHTCASLPLAQGVTLAW